MTGVPSGSMPQFPDQRSPWIRLARGTWPSAKRAGSAAIAESTAATLRSSAMQFCERAAEAPTETFVRRAELEPLQRQHCLAQVGIAPASDHRRRANRTGGCERSETVSFCFEHITLLKRQRLYEQNVAALLRAPRRTESARVKP